MTALAVFLWISSAFAGAAPWITAAPGQVRVGVHSGFPWHGVDAIYAPRGSVAVTGHVETARFQRTEVRAGLQRPWVLSPKWSVLTAATVGGVHQEGEVSRQGPQMGAVLIVTRMGRVEPFFSLHDRELFALQSVQTLTRIGEETQWTVARHSSRGGTLGMRVPIQTQWCLNMGIQAGSVDSAFAIPSFLLGMSWRSKE